jgi:hypothetical protein
MSDTDTSQLSLEAIIKEKHDLYLESYVRFYFDLPHCSHSSYINSALSECDIEEKAKIILGLTELLAKAYIDPNLDNCSTELQKIIGNSNAYDIKCPPYFTLSPHREQLRCWYGPHLRVRYEHVESNGHNLFFGINTEPKISRQLVKIIEKDYRVDRFQQNLNDDGYTRC